jgi:hypothetical protein
MKENEGIVYNAFIIKDNKNTSDEFWGYVRFAGSFICVNKGLNDKGENVFELIEYY